MPFSYLGGSKKPDYKKVKLNQHNLGYTYLSDPTSRSYISHHAT